METIFLVNLMLSLANLSAPDAFMHTVQLKPTIKVQISGRKASIGISDVVTTCEVEERILPSFSLASVTLYPFSTC